MPIQQRHIDELKAIYEQEFGQDISYKETWEMGKRLVSLIRVLLDDDLKQKDKNQSN